MTVMYIIEQLVTTWGQDSDLKDVYDNTEFVFVPIVNADGYAYTRKGRSERLWRKNRAKNAGSSCIGVDLNRNYGEHWCEVGASKSPCSDTYCGTKRTANMW